MDHLEAQAIVSEAMDHQPVEALVLAEAKEHCRTCPECSAFVSAQLTLRQTPLPEPPADLPDRVMAAIRADAQADDDAAQAARQAAEQAAAERAARAAEPIATLAPPKRRERRFRLPRPAIVGGLAAAMIAAVVGAGTLVVFGAHLMSSSPQRAGQLVTTAQSAAEAPTLDYKPGSKPSTTTPGATYGSGSAAADANGTTAEKATIAPASELITVNGVVYQQAGQASTSVDSMQVIGSTATALDTKKAATGRSVYQSLTAAGSVYVLDDNKQPVAFTKVTRTYLGLTFQLMSGDLTGYGQWPTLPASIAMPTKPDGSPTFTYDGVDSAGVKMYRLSTSPATLGVAIAPQSDSSGPAQGDPNWTWWAPAR